MFTFFDTDYAAAKEWLCDTLTALEQGDLALSAVDGELQGRHSAIEVIGHARDALEYLRDLERPKRKVRPRRKRGPKNRHVMRQRHPRYCAYWTRSDDEQLLRMSGQHETLKTIADVLGRAKNAVSHRRWLLRRRNAQR